MALRLRRRLYMRKWWNSNLEWTRVYRAMKKYGLTLDEYHAMYERQDFACAICGTDDSGLVVDHDHESGKVRGLLCNRCNTGLGMFGESQHIFAKACDYVVRHQGA